MMTVSNTESVPELATFNSMAEISSTFAQRSSQLPSLLSD